MVSLEVRGLAHWVLHFPLGSPVSLPYLEGRHQKIAPLEW